MANEVAKMGEAYLAPKVEVTSAPALPYVLFLAETTGKFSQIVQTVPGTQVPDPILLIGDSFTRLQPMKCHLFAAKQLWVERTKDKKATALSVTQSRPAFGSPQQEEILTALLLYTPNGLIAATSTFRKGLCKGANQMAQELARVATPALFSEWVGQSSDHRAAAKIEVPAARFTATITTALYPSRNGGRHPESRVTLKPTTVGDWTQIQKFLGDKGLEKMDAMMATHARRIQELLKLESK